MSEFKTPAGRLVQGMLTMQQRKDITTKQPVWKDAAKTIPDMGTFFSLAFPKSIAGGAPTYSVRPDLAAQGHTLQSLAAHGTQEQLAAQGYLVAAGGNPEWTAFHNLLKETAATAWPAFFPQGAGGACTNPKFSWKIQDGDGHDHMGVSVATKPGFAGHWIVKFDTNFPIKVYNEGHFAPHEELQQPEKIVRRGYWVRVFGELKSNMATGTQVPGIVLYPNLVSFLGGNPKDEIVSGPDAQQALGGQGAYSGWVPGGISTVPGAPSGLPAPGGLPLPTPGLPAPGGLPLPGPAPVAGPQYALIPGLVSQGVTMEALKAKGWTEEALVNAGHATRIG